MPLESPAGDSRGMVELTPRTEEIVGQMLNEGQDTLARLADDDASALLHSVGEGSAPLAGMIRLLAISKGVDLFQNFSAASVAEEYDCGDGVGAGGEGGAKGEGRGDGIGLGIKGKSAFRDISNAHSSPLLADPPINRQITTTDLEEAEQVITEKTETA